MGRPKTTEYRRVDIRAWRRQGLTEPGKSFVWRWAPGDEIQVRWGEGRAIFTERADPPREYVVPIMYRDEAAGGRRQFFLCPSCGRPCELLYGGARMLCRKCRALVYPSQWERRGERAARIAARIRRQLGWSPGILDPEGAKPWYMWRRKYDRLRARLDKLVQVYLDESTIDGL